MLKNKLKFKFMTLPIIMITGFTFSGSVFSAEYLADSSGEKVINTAKGCWQVKSGLDNCGGKAKKVITLSGSGLFDTGKANILPDLATSLNRVAARVRGNDYDQISIVGHTDDVGSASYNQNLSQRRAASVGSYLASRGLNASKIRTSGMGESHPVASNATAAGRHQNRRVVFIIN